MDDTLKRLIELGVNATPAIKEMQKVADETAKTSQGIVDIQKQLQGYADSIKSTFQGLGIGAAIDQAISGVRRMIDEFDQLGKSAQVAGTSVEKLQEMQFGLKLGAGMGGEEAMMTLTRFSDALANITDKTSNTSRILRELGVQAGDTADTGLRKIADRFAEAPDGINKTALAVELFGKNAQKMIPYLNQGSKGIDDMNDELKKLGGTISGDLAEQSAKFNDNMLKMGQNAKGAGQAIVSGLLPYLNDLTNFLTKSIEKGTFWADLWKRVKENWHDNEIYFRRAVTGQDWGETNLARRQSEQRIADYQEKNKAYAEQVARMLKPNTLPSTVAPHVESAGKAAAKAKTEFELWLESMDKIEQQSDDSGKKVAELTARIARLAAAGDTSSEAFKKYQAELLKVRPDALASELIKLADAAKKVDEATSDRMLKGLEDQLAALQANGPVATAQVKLLYDAIMKIKAERGDGLAIFQVQLEKTRAEAAKNAEQWEIVNQKLAENKITVAEYSELAAQYLPKVSQSMKEVKDDAVKLGDEVEKAGAKFVTDFIDQMIDGMGKADMSFEDMVTSMLKQLAKLMLQMEAAQLMKQSSGWGSAIGGLFSGGSASVQSQAANDDLMRDGGILARQSPSTLGASSSGIATGGSRPIDQSALSQPPGVTVNVNNTMAGDANVRTATKDNGDGTRQIDIYVERKVREMMSNGSLDRTMRSSYGVTRQPAIG